MVKRILILSQIVLLLFGGTAYAENAMAKRLFRKGEIALEKDDNHNAYLIFREIVRDYPSSEYADDAHFLIAHYYLQSKDYYQAEKELNILIKNYPDSPYVEDAKAYFSSMRSRFLDDKVTAAMNSGDYKAAKIFLEEILAIDPTNESAQSKLKDVDTILIKMDYQRQQFEKEKERLEDKSAAIIKAREEVSKLRLEAEKAMEKAETMTQQTINEYEERIAKFKEREAELEARIAELEGEVDIWRKRAKKYEAASLVSVGSSQEWRPSDTEYPKILFQGCEEDPEPNEREKIAQDIIREKSPSIVLTSEKQNEVDGMMKIELVLSLDLNENWPSKHYLKFRVHYTPITESEAPKPTVIYYSVADMDEVDTENSAYRKKIIVAIDRNRIQDYSVCAFFIEKK